MPALSPGSVPRKLLAAGMGHRRSFIRSARFQFWNREWLPCPSLPVSSPPYSDLVAIREAFLPERRDRRRFRLHRAGGLA